MTAVEDLPFLPTTSNHRARVPDEAPALFDDASSAWMSYGALRTNIETTAKALKGAGRGVVLCCVPRSCEGVIAYLAVAHAGHTIIMADPTAPNLDLLAACYQPEWIIASQNVSFDYYERDYTVFDTLCLNKRHETLSYTIHPDLYLVLLTSGTTGSSKGVRLTYRNLTHNTQAIIHSLSLTNSETALCHLPLAYSFGLSIIHMQLAVGGRCLMSEQSLMSAALWRLARTQSATLFAGVPYHYEMLMRLGLARLNTPSLRTFLQAGGRMQPPHQKEFLTQVQSIEGGKFFIMYGQTEASPRISCFGLHERPEKIGSSGKALMDGKITIEDGVVVYTGPNVMMGYAETRSDLENGDTMHGCLETGDLGSLDEEGFLTISGRKQRFAKLFGQRVSLDDLEKLVSSIAFVVAMEHPEKVVLFALRADESDIAAIKNHVVEMTKLPAPWIEVRAIEEIPHKQSGKIDYAALQTLVSLPQ